MRMLLFALLTFATALAQVDTGVLTGVVKDNAGAMIAGAKVTIRNTGTNAQMELVTSASGSYVSPPLPSGTYRIEVSQPGFRTSARMLPLNVSERLAVEFAASQIHVKRFITEDVREEYGLGTCIRHW